MKRIYPKACLEGAFYLLLMNVGSLLLHSLSIS